jgi:hypothetical protein
VGVPNERVEYTTCERHHRTRDQHHAGVIVTAHHHDAGLGHPPPTNSHSAEVVTKTRCISPFRRR